MDLEVDALMCLNRHMRLDPPDDQEIVVKETDVST